MMRRNGNKLALALVGAALAAPHAAVGAEREAVSAAASLQARSNVDARRAAAIAQHAPSRARKLVVASRAKLGRAYLLTRQLQDRSAATGREVSSRFSRALRTNTAYMRRTAAAESAGLSAESSRALSANGDLQAAVAVALGARLAGSSTHIDAGAVAAFGTQAIALESVATTLVASTHARSAELRERLRSAIARCLEAARSLSDDALAMKDRARGRARARLRAAAERLAAWTDRVRRTLDGSAVGDSHVSVGTRERTTLGEVAVDVATDTNVNAGAFAIGGDTGAGADGSLGLPQLG